MRASTRWVVSVMILLLLPHMASALALPRHDPVPGGVAIVPIELKSPAPPQVFYDGRIVMVVRNQSTWVAVVGIPLEVKPGPQTLKVRRGGESIQQVFTVQDKHYKESRITLKNPRMVNPNEDDLKRISKEKTQIRSALAHWTEEVVVHESFLIPVEGRLSSPFGLRRYLNGQARRPHSGLDIAAPVGTPVWAPSPARVVDTGHFFFNGKTVFLDHGQGLVTMYCHLDRIDVEPGQVVNRGDTIGLVGMTGRSTGAHLHWSVSLNRTMVEPLLFLPEDVVAQSAQKDRSARAAQRLTPAMGGSR